MAVDWLSGSIYWTDALYNWITVARLIAQDIFNHIITTELDRPVGIAVHPQNGYLPLTYSCLVGLDLGYIASVASPSGRLRGVVMRMSVCPSVCTLT